MHARVYVAEFSASVPEKFRPLRWCKIGISNDPQRRLTYLPTNYRVSAELKYATRLLGRRQALCVEEMSMAFLPRQKYPLTFDYDLGNLIASGYSECFDIAALSRLIAGVRSWELHQPAL